MNKIALGTVSSDPPNVHLNTKHYRPDIDGLRAVAVVPVILFHQGYEIFSGGFIGVDIFFVISGYLISHIILRELSKGSFSILRFYERRARRILPSFVLMLVITLPLAFAILLPHQLKDFFQSIAASSLFFSNYFFHLETDYFNEFSNNAPLLHTWSLSVEEQFYLVYPVILICAHYLRFKILIPFLLTSLVISFLYAEYTVLRDPSLAFYSTLTRSWELLLGCLTAVYMRSRDMSVSNRSMIDPLCESLVILALLGIVGSIIFFDEHTPFPSRWALIPTLSTVLLLIYGYRSVVAKYVLGNKAFVYIGLLSYSLYIFHQPIISFSKYYYGLNEYASTPFLKYVSLFVILVVSILAYHLVEKPFRFAKSFSRKNVLSSSAALLICFAGIGVFGHFQNGFLQYYSEKYSESGGVKIINFNDELALTKKYSAGSESIIRKSHSDKKSQKILIIGDSLSKDAANSLLALDSEVINDSSIRSLAVDDECMAVFLNEIETGSNHSKCRLAVNSMATAMQLIERSTHILLVAKWQSKSYENGIALGEFLAKRYPETIVFVSGFVMFNDLASLSLEFAKKKIKPHETQKYMFENIRYDRLVINNKMENIVTKSKKIRWVDKVGLFCQFDLKECNVFDKDGDPLIWDSIHLTVRGYARYGKLLFDQLGLVSGR